MVRINAVLREDIALGQQHLENLVPEDRLQLFHIQGGATRNMPLP